MAGGASRRTILGGGGGGGANGEASSAKAAEAHRPAARQSQSSEHHARASLATPCEPRQRGVQRRVALGEAEARDGADRRLGVEGRDRNRRDAMPLDQIAAEGDIVVAAERREVDVEEIGAGARQDREAARREAGGEAVAAALVAGAHRGEIGIVLGQAVGDRRLEVGRRGEGDELVRLGEHAQQLRRGHDEADLPAGQREDLAGRADLDRALAHARHRHQRQMAEAVEHHVLPDLVADGDGVVAHAGAGENLERLAAVDDAGRVERIVEQDDARARREGGGEIGLVEGPKRRLQRDELRHAAGAANQRQIGVVHRLEQHDLVAGLDQRHQRAGDRLGRARGHHHLALGIELEPLEAPVVGGDRRAQLRQAEHRRILVPAVDDRLGRLGAHVGAGRDRQGSPGRD